MNVASLLVTASLAFASLAHANPLSPVGRWQTIDDKTGQPRAIVRIYEVEGTLQGDIEKVFYRPDEKPNATCPRCPEPQKGKPIIGMTVLWGLKPNGIKGASKPGYDKGSILDPSNATVYKCKVWVEEGGKALDVRGFVGFTGALGRTQRWHRLA